jgi:lipopolysaccharide transport system ATP-binding protein
MTALSVNNLSKKYKLYDNNRARIKEWLFLGHKKCHRDLWALKDVTFDVPRGQSLGIIGRNGSGKSTLLKMIVGVSSPTEGSVTVNGSVSALLELGAGFHPEFTGRDNIYMNAALLGIDASFVEKKYAEIVEFSELGQFINVPVKFYSSGMVVRLGFSVAIHMDPEVLVIDEALAVGDMQFQRKCINAMREFKRRGVTIILVTHSLGDVGSFCDRVICMEGGVVSMDGRTEQVIEHYRDKLMGEEKAAAGSSLRLNPLKSEIRTSEDIGKVRIIEVGFYDKDGRETQKITTGERLVIRIGYNAEEGVHNPLFRVVFYRSDGLLMFATNTYRQGLDLGEVHGEGIVELEIESFNLNEGRYYVTVNITPDEYSSFMADRAYDTHDMAYVIEVESERAHGGGLVYLPNTWRKV